jgi:alpha-beta hydrolase superfamily lysophospholipase
MPFSTTISASPNFSQKSLASFLAAAPRLSEGESPRKIRSDLLIYVFSGSEDPVGLRLKGVGILIERYRKAGINSIDHHFYPGGRHEMLNEINRDEVVTNLVAWISATLRHRPSA